MFNADLRRVRERRKLSKHDVANQTGLSYQHIHNLEQGRRTLTITVLRQLDRCLKFPDHVLVNLIRCADTDPGTRAGLLLLALVLA